MIIWIGWMGTKINGVILNVKQSKLPLYCAISAVISHIHPERDQKKNIYFFSPFRHFVFPFLRIQGIMHASRIFLYSSFFLVQYFNKGRVRRSCRHKSGGVSNLLFNYQNPRTNLIGWCRTGDQGDEEIIKRFRLFRNNKQGINYFSFLSNIFFSDNLHKPRKLIG